MINDLWENRSRNHIIKGGFMGGFCLAFILLFAKIFNCLFCDLRVRHRGCIQMIKFVSFLFITETKICLKHDIYKIHNLAS